MIIIVHLLFTLLYTSLHVAHCPLSSPTQTFLVLCPAIICNDFGIHVHGPSDSLTSQDFESLKSRNFHLCATLITHTWPYTKELAIVKNCSLELYTCYSPCTPPSLLHPPFLGQVLQCTFTCELLWSLSIFPTQQGAEHGLGACSVPCSPLLLIVPANPQPWTHWHTQAAGPIREGSSTYWLMLLQIFGVLPSLGLECRETLSFHLSTTFLIFFTFPWPPAFPPPFNTLILSKLAVSSYFISEAMAREQERFPMYIETPLHLCFHLDNGVCPFQSGINPSFQTLFFVAPSRSLLRLPCIFNLSC